MPRKLISHFGESVAVSLHVPNELDYWERNGKRVNFRAARINSADLPEWTGFNLIIWIFSLYIAWKARQTR